MYVRFNVDHKGHLKLQQLLTFENHDNSEAKHHWENVPLTGLGSSQSIDTPLAIKCGLFFIKEFKTINVVSALSIEKITEIEENKIRIETYDKKKFFFINTSQFEFIILMTKLLNKFDIIHINDEGNIISENQEVLC